MEYSLKSLLLSLTLAALTVCLISSCGGGIEPDLDGNRPKTHIQQRSYATADPAFFVNKKWYLRYFISPVGIEHEPVDYSVFSISINQDNSVEGEMHCNAFTATFDGDRPEPIHSFNKITNCENPAAEELSFIEVIENIKKIEKYGNQSLVLTAKNGKKLFFETGGPPCEEPLAITGNEVTRMVKIEFKSAGTGISNSAYLDTQGMTLVPQYEESQSCSSTILYAYVSQHRLNSLRCGQRINAISYVPELDHNRLIR